MNDHVLILNAGSSSLKFCVYRPPRNGNLDMVVRGQIEGIGGAAVLSAKDSDGKTLVDKKPYALVFTAGIGENSPVIRQRISTIILSAQGGAGVQPQKGSSRKRKYRLRNLSYSLCLTGKRMNMCFTAFLMSDSTSFFCVISSSAHPRHNSFCDFVSYISMNSIPCTVS